MSATGGARPPDPDLQRLRRTEDIIGIGRMLAGAWALTHRLAVPGAYPEHLQPAATVIVAILVIVGPILWVVHRRIDTYAAQRRFGLVAYAIDLTFALAIVGLFAFDPFSSTWTVLILVAIEGAIRFQPAGAIAGWGLITGGIAAREAYADAVYGVRLEVQSIAFRAVVVLIVVTIIAAMQRDLERERHQLELTVDRLQRVEAWRQRLISMLAHDIRSPLATVTSSIGLLEDRRHELDDATIGRIMEGMSRQTRRVTLLTRDLLDLARSEQATLILHYQPVDVRNLLHEVAVGLPVTIDASNDLPDIDADPARLEQILFNLLRNAMKHGAEPITLSARRRANAVEFTVEDHGDGIPADQLPTLFDAFTSTSADIESTGLGLWIAHALSQAHGGSLTYQPVLPHGARFTIRIPVAAARPNRPPAAATTGVGTR